jgi:hypothetical protein
MTTSDQAFHDAVLRKDFNFFLRRCFMTLNPGSPYLPNWHIRLIGFRLERIRRGKTKRLIINMPPRHLKSLTVSVAFAAFLLGHEPKRRIFVISYGNELSSKHASDFRSIVESAWYRRAFPAMQIDRSLEDEVSTTARGFRISTSVYGTLTGLGGDVFIIDDPQKPVDAQSDTQRNRLNHWVSNTLMSRLDSKENGIIIVGEALHPELESLESLERLRREIGSDVFAAQYQQSPVPPGGAMIRREWLRYYDKPPERTYRTKIIQSWDTAAKDGAGRSARRG